MVGLLDQPKLGGAILLAGAALILMLVLTGCGPLPMTVSETPAPESPTAVKAIVPELANLDVTQAALNVQGTALALHSTELANVALSAAITQQAEIYGTQQAWQAIHYAMTATVDEQIAARATEQAQATAESVRSNTAFRESVTKTAVTWQSTAAAATQSALEQEWTIADNQRATTERLAGIETVLWRIIAPLGVLGLLYMAALVISRIVSVYLKQQIAPVELEPETFIDDEQPVTYPPVRVEIQSNEGKTTRIASLPADPHKLAVFGAGVIGGGGLSEAVWTGGGKLFSVSEFRILRDAMIAARLAKWNNPEASAQGWKFTPEGWAVMGQLARETPPSPTLGLSVG